MTDFTAKRQSLKALWQRYGMAIGAATPWLTRGERNAIDKQRRKEARRELRRSMWHALRPRIKGMGVGSLMLAAILILAAIMASIESAQRDAEQAEAQRQAQSASQAKAETDRRNAELVAGDVTATSTPAGKILDARPVVFGGGEFTAITTEKMSLVIHAVTVVPIGVQSTFMVQSNGWCRFTWEGSRLNYAVYKNE